MREEERFANCLALWGTDVSSFRNQSDEGYVYLILLVRTFPKKDLLFKICFVLLYQQLVVSVRKDENYRTLPMEMRLCKLVSIRTSSTTATKL